MQLILASTSKYRQELLKKLGVDFMAHSPLFDEEAYKKSGQKPLDLCMTLAAGKAESLRQSFPHATIIGSDQMLVQNDQIFGKSGSFKASALQLKKLQGKPHELLTSLYVINEKNTFRHLNVTTLFMKPLTDAEIEEYLKLDEPYDCAGSYKIESHGRALFEKIETDDFNAIIGLPLLELAKILQKLGYQIPESTLGRDIKIF